MSKYIFSFILFSVSNMALAQEWFAVARHGECTDLATVNDRNDIVKGAETPFEMESMLKAANVGYSLERILPEQDAIFKLDVPSKGWEFILVKKKICREFSER